MQTATAHADTQPHPTTRKTAGDNRWATVRSAAAHYSDAGFTEASIRWLIFNGQTNGFENCIRRIGRKVLIDLDAMDEWIDQQGRAAA